MIQRVLIRVKELIHVATKRIPNVQMDPQHHGVCILQVASSLRDYAGMSSKSVIHSQRLHGDVVDAEVVTTLERRKREGDDSLQLTVALRINRTTFTNLVFEAVHPFDFAIMEIAIPLLSISFKEEILTILTA